MQVHLQIKIISFIILSSLLTTVSNAQILNASFEQWETIDNYEIPLHWQSNQDSETNRIEKSDESVDGNYSLKLVPDDSISGFSHVCKSIVEAGFSLANPVGHEKSLYYYLKSEALYNSDTAIVTVKVEFYREGSRVKLEFHPHYHPIAEFTLQQIPFPHFQIDSVYIEIYGAAATGSDGYGCRYLSNIWIDNIFIDENTATEYAVMEKNNLLYPNPASGILHLDQSVDPIIKYEIYNMQGILIQTENGNNRTINLDNPGMHIVLLYTRNGDIYSQKVFNRSF